MRARTQCSGGVCPSRAVPRVRLTGAFGGAMIRAVREGNPRCAGGRTGTHKGHSVNQARDPPVNRSYRPQTTERSPLGQRHKNSGIAPPLICATTAFCLSRETGSPTAHTSAGGLMPPERQAP